MGFHEWHTDLVLPKMGTVAQSKFGKTLTWRCFPFFWPFVRRTFTSPKIGLVLWSFLCFLSYQPEQAFEQIIKLLVLALTLIWHKCDRMQCWHLCLPDRLSVVAHCHLSHVIGIVFFDTISMAWNKCAGQLATGVASVWRYWIRSSMGPW